MRFILYVIHLDTIIPDSFHICLSDIATLRVLFFLLVLIINDQYENFATMI